MIKIHIPLLIFRKSRIKLWKKRELLDIYYRKQAESQESMWRKEIGAKSNWRMRRIRVTLSVVSIVQGSTSSSTKQLILVLSWCCSCFSVFHLVLSFCDRTCSIFRAIAIHNNLVDQERDVIYGNTIAITRDNELNIHLRFARDTSTDENARDAPQTSGLARLALYRRDSTW